MLFRLVNHHKDNSEMRDKLICINGLPESFYIVEQEGEKVLKPPFVRDVEKNLPKEIKAHFKERLVVKEVVHALNEAGIQERYRHDKKYLPLTIQCLRIDCASGPGEDAWADVERYLEKEIPANVRVKPPRIVGDQLNWTLEVEDVPVIDLVVDKPVEPEKAVQAVSPVIEQPAPAPAEPPAPGTIIKPEIKMFNGKPYCTECKTVYKNMNSFRSHNHQHHKVKEPANA